MIENSMQSGQIYTYQERLKETEENNAELRKILRRYSKGDKLTKSPFAKLESWKPKLNLLFREKLFLLKMWIISWNRIKTGLILDVYVFTRFVGL